MPSRVVITLAAITLVGGILRFWDPDRQPYGGDDDLVVGMAREIAFHGALPTGIQTSVGIPNGPVAAYLLALPMAMSTSHTALAWVFAALNTAAIPVMYLLGRNTYGPSIGILAALLFAVNPWLVVFSRRLWLNALIAPAAVLFLWTLSRSVGKASGPRWMLVGAALSGSVQLHLSSIPNALGLIGLGPAAPALSRVGLTAGAIVAVVLMLPWLIGSVWPAAAMLDFHQSAASDGWSLDSLERAQTLLTGRAYQATAGYPPGPIDTTAPPFQLVDLLTRLLGSGGWLWLVWTGWRERQRRPARSAVALVAAAMAALPVAALARPPRAGNLEFLFLHYFINVLPPLILGMAALARALPRPLGIGGTVLIAGVQLVLAVPFLSTPQDSWRFTDYAIPWRYTQALLGEMQARSVPFHAPVNVGGEAYAEQGKLAGELLRRDYDQVRIHDGRDGVVFVRGAPRQLLVSTSDDHTMSRFLLQEFGGRQVFQQHLPGTRWTRRIFELSAADIEEWARTRLAPIPPVAGPPTASTPPLIEYRAAGLVTSPDTARGPMLALLWQFQAEPTDHFFTDVVLIQDDTTAHREEHVAYPIAFWEPGDWSRIGILNLFELPRGLAPGALTGLVIEHRGILSGREVAPPVRFSLLRILEDLTLPRQGGGDLGQSPPRGRGQAVLASPSGRGRPPARSAKDG